MSTEKLYSTADLAEELEMTKQGMNQAVKAGRIEAPAYYIGAYKGWTEEQVERIKGKIYEKEQEIKDIVRCIPYGLTPSGSEYLKHNPELALKYLEQAIKECENEMEKVINSDDKKYIGMDIFVGSCKERFEQIRDNLTRNSKNNS
ncbi:MULTISPECIES: hypothetical protein [Bacillus]|uniref:Uncharacterized protein pXO2-74/BXB0102/GBAA_pXO2_0102 n=2 Tax=Bacillus anthracis TaxID=1392 RepID=Y6602_BACAN|nr:MULTISPECIES: hypothetical protein [Bacillus]Q9RMW0.1 RecName: Full=Uncharacterized protein pXO2-74/BXB0102/GBAA_pXO2_0102 [Bacillus anthracis]AAM26253.1 hypothetical protein BX_B0102 [Bacillus anthracis str. A2012]HDR4493608.1 hypothetical protein [Bacillus cereus biovar anthracis]AAF13679.1 pXO2-74 [Bacillus anthracis]AAT35515.1 ImpB/MucB/SamB family [Bacillus anthracis str. 'Ames Ancestor']ACP11969.1 ImpB/MucB/SamB family [Bacillus anthracis str. CDC 684]